MAQEPTVVDLDDEDLKSIETGFYSLYTKDQKIEAVTLYCSGKSLAEAAKIINVPAKTVVGWKRRSSWWDEIALKHRKDLQTELDNKLTNVIHKTLEELNDRLNYGDHKFDTKTGDLVRVPVVSRDLAVIMSNLYEKRALIRGEATSIKQESQATLQTLEDKFKSFALQLQQKDVVSTVELPPLGNN